LSFLIGSHVHACLYSPGDRCGDHYALLVTIMRW
jgi:hypothetical protein